MWCVHPGLDSHNPYVCVHACVRSMLVHEPLSSQYCSWSLDTGASAVVLTFHQFDVGAVVGGECASTEMRV